MSDSLPPVPPQQPSPPPSLWRRIPDGWRTVIIVLVTLIAVFLVAETLSALGQQ